MAKPQRVTSTDVALEAGVSRTTVSFVLNNTSGTNISPATRRRVLEAAAKLNYAPSPTARALRRGYPDVALLLVPRWPVHYAMGDYLVQLSRAFDACGFSLLVHPQMPRSPLAGVWRRFRPAVLLIFEDITDQERADTEKAGIPILNVSLVEMGESGVNVSQYTNEALGRLQTQHLVDKGHQRIGYAYPGDPNLDYFAKARLGGVREVTTHASLDDPVVQTVGLSVDAATAAIETWRSADSPITAVCAFNDDVALALMAGMRELNLAVPEDLAIIGVDDIPAAALATPPLSTVRRSMVVLGRQTARAVVKRLERPMPPVQWDDTEPAKTVERATT